MMTCEECDGMVVLRKERYEQLLEKEIWFNRYRNLARLALNRQEEASEIDRRLNEALELMTNLTNEIIDTKLPEIE